MDIDRVITLLEQAGLRCGKDKDRQVLTNKAIGGVRWSVNDGKPFCSTTHLIYLHYDLVDNTVISSGNDERKSCF